MSDTPPPAPSEVPGVPEETVIKVVRLKAAGCSWEHIATKVDLSVDVLRDLPFFLNGWGEEYEYAQKQARSEFCDEAIAVTRRELRNMDPKLALKAAELGLKLLMTELRHQRADAPDEEDRMATPEGRAAVFDEVIDRMRGDEFLDGLRRSTGGRDIWNVAPLPPLPDEEGEGDGDDDWDGGPGGDGGPEDPTPNPLSASGRGSKPATTARGPLEPGTQ